MSKGSNRRPKYISEQQFEENWDTIFARKKTPKHAQTKVHRDKTKYTRKIKHSVELFALIGIFCVSILGVSPNIKADDNSIEIKQVNGGDYFALDITQEGWSNIIDFSFDHQNNTVDLFQSGNNNYIGYTDAWGSGYTWGGDLDGQDNEIEIRQKCSFSTCNDNDFQFHIQGNYNNVVFGQGYENNNSLTPSWSYDGTEPGGNFVRLDIHGDYNDFKGSQKQDSSNINHSITANIYGDYNDVFVKQMQNGNKTLNLTLNNDNNDISVVQKKNGAHTATITLSGTYGTNLNLTQTGDTTQTYSLTQTCATVGGCSVTVTQGN